MYSDSSQISLNENTLIGIYGAGGFAREVMPLVRDMLEATDLDVLREQLVFIETTASTDEVNGFKVLSEDAFFEMPHEDKLFNVAIADSKAREAIANRCIEKGAKPLAVEARTAASLAQNDIGEGALLCGNTIITANAKIGKFFHANIFSYVAHDCVIGDYVTFAPRVNCNGNVHIKDHAYIGTGAILKQGSSEKPLIIGEGAIVGMGAVVTKDVPANTVVVGNPARPLGK
ncbi:acetyltransferase [Kordiimonas sp. SCSIO 12603]|uniref:acetyltransferase n=1 Tax=Kordiimonas sp. SCSIO 12603 TaxID=2829596 RepID=UPI0021FCA604|nr:acetyltransferase [Kordiimonas sp. SCSIO 12603]